MAEKEYIEREALQNKAFGEKHPTFYDGQDIADWYEKCINETPAADVAPVVRCKDCIYAYINSFAKVAGTVSCKFWADKSCGTAYTMQQNDFCSYGVRKEFYNGKD